MSSNDSERDWFAPPPSQGTQPPAEPAQPPAPPPPLPARPRRGQHRQPFSPAARPRQPRGVAPFPDQQVWPPPSSRPVSSATQPMPAVPSAGPLPSRKPPAPPPAEASPAEPEAGAEQAAHGAEGHAQAAERAPAAAGAEQAAHGAEGGPAAAGPAARRGRTLLLGVGAVVVFALAVGLPTADRYLFYESGQPTETLHVVPVGQQVTYEHVTWQGAIEPTSPPESTSPDRQWLKITVTRKAIDDTGAVLTGRPELTVRDRRDRTWQVEIVEDDMPAEKHEVHRAYDYTALAVVPKAVADEVELHLAPNITYRSDTPTEKLLEVTPEDQEKAERNDVLIFRR